MPNAKESIDFRGRHKWIDDMMRLLGAPLENEPAVMHNKWEILIKECEHLDISKQSTVMQCSCSCSSRLPSFLAKSVAFFASEHDP